MCDVNWVSPEAFFLLDMYSIIKINPWLSEEILTDTMFIDYNFSLIFSLSFADWK